jgi:hypothetical protein
MGDIDTYWNDGYKIVEGWVFPGLIDFLKCVGRFQLEAKITGNIAEIGVHHGRLLIALAHMLGSGGTCLALDVFDDQSANVDGSGRGSLDKLRENIAQFAPPDVEFAFIKADSLALTAPTRMTIAQEHGPFRIFSIDGGHTVEHTYNDLQFAQDMLAVGGVIMVDDYYNLHWPGVHEGVGLFYTRGVPRIKPFMYAHNKLFFAGIAFHRRYLRWSSDMFCDRRGFKVVKMYGADAMVVA